MGRPKKDQTAQPTERKPRTPAPEGCKMIRVAIPKEIIKTLKKAGVDAGEYVATIVRQNAITLAAKVEQAQAAHDKLMRDLIHQPSPPPAPFVEQPATEADHG
jgi:hypothetical protein